MNPDFEESRHAGMGTVITHRVYGDNRREALRAAARETERLERLLSRFAAESDISRINAAAGREAVEIAEETAEVLSAARTFSEVSRGAFDATVAPLVTLWNVRDSTRPPERAEIRRLLPLVDYSDLALDETGRRAGLKRTGQALDLGGVGKGFASDRIVRVFKEFGIESAFTNFGGNVSTLGIKPDGTPWRVGIRHPRRSGTLIGAVSVAGQSVVTSGDDQRFFVASDGKRYHHILDPRTGYPADSGLISATVVSESAAAADAFSTALFVLGPEQGLGILKRHPEAGAVLVGRDLTVRVTANLGGAFTAADGIAFGLLDF